MTGWEMTGMVLLALLVKDWEHGTLFFDRELTQGGSNRSLHAWTVPVS